jgi:TRAP-type mannitol/chloroaromatic compound transport system permease large subunit
VLLAVNMQTSFMHPPFGFALFYLRSVAPAYGQDDGHLLGGDSLRLHPDHHGGADHHLP